MTLGVSRSNIKIRKIGLSKERAQNLRNHRRKQVYQARFDGQLYPKQERSRTTRAET